MIAATIIAIFLIFGMGDGSLGSMMGRYVEDPIKIAIVEEDRRDMALDELSSLQDAIKELNKGVSKDVERFDDLVKNYDSTPAEFDQMISAVFASREQEVGKIWEQRSAMLKHIKPDEWKTIISDAKAAATEDAAQ